jgi:hypothetical protein
MRERQAREGGVATVRLGYVGGGFMAQKVHLPNFTALPDCRVVALAELRPRLGETVRARFGIPRLYPDHRAMLADAEIDAVAVSAVGCVNSVGTLRRRAARTRGAGHPGGRGG